MCNEVLLNNEDMLADSSNVVQTYEALHFSKMSLFWLFKHFTLMEISTFVSLTKVFWIKLTSVTFMKINCSLNTFISLYFNLINKFNHPLLYFHLLKYSHIPDLCFYFSKCQTGMCCTKVSCSKIIYISKYFLLFFSLFKTPLHTKWQNRIFINVWHTVIFKIFVTLISLKTNKVFKSVCLHVKEYFWGGNTLFKIAILSTPEKQLQ